MTIQIFLFGPARLVAGLSESTIEVPEGCRVRQAAEILFGKWPSLRPVATQLRYAVDEEYAELEAVLHPGQTLALIPPVEGG